MTCDGTPPTDGTRSRAPTPVPRYTGPLPKSRGDRDAEERATVAELLGRLDGPLREFVEQTLRSPDWNTATSIAGMQDSVAARLLGKIYGLREARFRDERVAEMQAVAALRSAPVTVGLLPAASDRKSAFVVVRTRIGENFILLSSPDLTPEKVAHSFRTLARSRARHGEFPAEPVRVYAARGKAPPASAEERAFAEDVLVQLERAPMKPIPGYGTIPAVTVTVGPAKG